MEYCLWCNEELIFQMNWGNVININKRANLCTLCYERLEVISEKRCQNCSRQSETKKCEDCRKWGKIYAGNDPLTKNISLFTYNEFMKEIITKWKYRGDFVVGEIFRYIFFTQFERSFSNLKKQAILTPIPLSEDRLFDRGFNQAYVLATFLSGNVTELLERVHSEKQSKKSRFERMTTINPFKLKEPTDKPVILIDDIYTTGRTIRHAAAILKANGCPEVYGYTLVRG